jgi:uncharacterized repeat protein (TIGR02543 family)
VTISSPVVVSGDVKLVLSDGCNLVCSQGIQVPEGSSLTISGNGTLTATATGQANAAGIGGYNGVNGDITIKGGKINAAGGLNGAGIGGGYIGTPKDGENKFLNNSNYVNNKTHFDIGGSITITGGSITAQGDYGGAGIGGGYQNRAKSITIENADSVTATGNNGAGIGGGFCADSGDIRIEECGEVTARADSNGAGIGGGYMGTCGNITISDTNITAYGGNSSAGIGSGSFATDPHRNSIAYGGKISIKGGTLEAAGGNSGGAGIGAGFLSDCKSITLDGVTIKGITGGSNAAGIGGGYRESFSDACAEITITNCTEKSETEDNDVTYSITGGTNAAGIGGGYMCPTGNITIKDSSLSVKGGGAGIGGGSAGDSSIRNLGNDGEITISGGNITAKGGNNAAGIGGGYRNKYSNITISDMTTLTAYAGIEGAGIGSGSEANSGDISISSCPHVKAYGGLGGAGIGSGKAGSCKSITIAKSSVEAYGDHEGSGYASGGAGIGGGMGSSKSSSSGNVDTITITDSSIAADGGKNAAGIGGGIYGKCNNITISCKDKTVTAVSAGNGAGIGGGFGNSGGNITIDGGNVYAKSRNGGPGIGNGACYYAEDNQEPDDVTCDINIKDGTVTAIGTSGGAGIGSGNVSRGMQLTGKITISGGTVTAFGYDRDDNSYKPLDPGNGYSDTGSGAGIGGGTQQDGWDTTINGGTVKAYGGRASAGIGGGQNGGSGTLTIGTLGSDESPVIEAYGGFGAAGIGTGRSVNELNGMSTLRGSVTIDGGKIYAEGGDRGAGIGGGANSAVKTLTINGGDIKAIGRAQTCDIDGSRYMGGAGIGTGSYFTFNNNATISITGGTITACGGAYDKEYGKEYTGNEYHRACGIGGGDGTAVGSISITGGDITAEGGDQSAGIGTGRWFKDNNEPEISISAPDKDDVPKISAKGGSGAAGIGGGIGAKIKSISISGGDVTATGNDGGAGIGCGRYKIGGSITIEGGTVQAFGSSVEVTENGSTNTYDADDIGKGAQTGDGSCSFSTGNNGCAVIVAEKITDQSKKNNWSGIYIPDKNTRGEIWSHSVDVTTPEYLPEGYSVDVLYKDDDHVTFSVGKEYFKNYGTFYVYGTYYNLNENKLTNVDPGRVIYMIKSINVTDADTMKYKSGANLSLDGMKVNVAFKDDKGETGYIDWNSPVISEGFSVSPADGKTLYSSDNGRYIKVSFITHEETFTGQTPDALVVTTDVIPAEDYTVKYDANGGAGSMISQTAKRGESVIVSQNQFTRLGYSFTGWNTMADGTGEEYQPGSRLKADSSITLYAQWKKNAAPTKAKKPFMVLAARPHGSHAEKLTWTRIKGADGYDLYFAKCGHKFKKIKTIKSWKTKKYYKKGLKKAVVYKYKIKAYKISDGEKKYMCSAIAAHAVAGGYNRKSTDARSIKAVNKRLTLKVGKTAKVSAKQTKLKKNRSFLKTVHANYYRYRSTDKTIAKVNSKGKVTAVSKGRCRICIQSQNGLAAFITVIVK